jgi:hypothetical protein
MLEARIVLESRRKAFRSMIGSTTLIDLLVAKVGATNNGAGQKQCARCDDSIGSERVSGTHSVDATP